MNSLIKGIIASLLISAVFAAIWVKYGQKISYEENKAPVAFLDGMEQVGAPEFELPLLNGGQFALSSTKGSVVLVNFWATWCAPCVTEFPSMLRLVRYFDGKVKLVTISADERKQDVVDFVNSFKGEVKDTYHVWDPEIKVAKLYGTVRMPETYIFGTDFKLKKKVVNAVEWDSAEVKSYISQLIK
jgi:cytochrome c biogenesis protein CcmG/thiol:disulfide interchange protein DsbE